MQLLFNKDEDGNISVYFVDSEENINFSYAEMIKRIYDDKVIEDAKITGSFSEKERQSITELIDSCRKVIDENKEQGAEIEDELNDLDWLDSL